MPKITCPAAQCIDVFLSAATLPIPCRARNLAEATALVRAGHGEDMPDLGSVVREGMQVAWRADQKRAWQKRQAGGRLR